MAMVTDKVLRRHNDLLAGQPTEDLGHHLVDGLFVVRLQLVFVLGVENFTARVRDRQKDSRVE